MIHIAFKMQVHLDKFDEYKRRHDELWPEMRQVLKEHGASQYHIFLDESTGALFAHAIIESKELWDAVPRTDVCQKWWVYMGDIMDTNPDGSPWSVDLKEVFCL